MFLLTVCVLLAIAVVCCVFITPAMFHRRLEKFDLDRIEKLSDSLFANAVTASENARATAQHLERLQTAFDKAATYPIEKLPYKEKDYVPATTVNIPFAYGELIALGNLMIIAQRKDNPIYHYMQNTPALETVFKRIDNTIVSVEVV